MTRHRNGRTVVVTGASAGIGRAAAVAFARRGDRVALIARGRAGLDAVTAEVEAAGGHGVPLAVDVSDAQQVDDAANRVEQEIGPIDVWVNDAFSSVFAPADQISADEMRRIHEVTYLGYVHGTLAALRRMRPRDAGAIVHVGSALAYRGIPLQSGYCAAKHAIQGFHESLRCELMHAKSGVHTTMVQMPAVNTPQFNWVLSRLDRRPQPVPPIFEPETVARAVTYAADHPNRREYWVGGSTCATLLANRLAPGLLDRYMARSGFDSQQTSAPQPDDAPANLWEPVDEEHDFGTAGPFGDRSRSTSPQLSMSRHRRMLGCGAVAAAALLTSTVRSLRR